MLGPNYFTPGNELPVWPLLAVAFGIGATTRRAGQLGPALGAAACVAMLAITVSSPLDGDLQRDDWRALIASLNASPGTRGVRVLEAVPDTPVVRYYLERAAPPRPARAIAVIGRPVGPAASYFTPPRPGMRLDRVEARGGIAYARFEAHAPVEVPGMLYQR